MNIPRLTESRQKRRPEYLAESRDQRYVTFTYLRNKLLVVHIFDNLTWIRQKCDTDFTVEKFAQHCAGAAVKPLVLF